MMEQWSAERANEWFASIPWPFGCNFLPSTAVNSTEMWQADTFDPATIERELQLAAGLGYNTVRVFLQFMVWEADPAGHNERMETFLRLADAAGITMMPILFDDRRFDDRDPYPGRQDEPKPGGAQQPLDTEPRLRHRRRPGALATSAARSVRQRPCGTEECERRAGGRHRPVLVPERRCPWHPTPPILVPAIAHACRGP